MLGICTDYTRDPCPKHMWHPAIPHVDARFRKRARETYISHISGIITHENQPISMQTLDSQARAKDTHQWHHSTSKPAIPHVDAPFQKRARETNISGITASSHESPFTPFPHVDARFHTQVRKVNTEVIQASALSHISQNTHHPSVDAVSRNYASAVKIHISGCQSPCTRCVLVSKSRKLKFQDMPRTLGFHVLFIAF